MPYETILFQLPCGARCFRFVLGDSLTREDAAAMVRQVGAGGELYGLPALIEAMDLKSISSDARAGRGDVRNRETWTAVLMANPVIRVTANFIMRIQQSRKTKLFSSEPEALEWLDARIREQLAKAGAPPD
jgi:hypothetical protein